MNKREVINWIKTQDFRKWEPCDCDTGQSFIAPDGICFSCRHRANKHGEDGYCVELVRGYMSRKEVIETILSHLESMK